MRRSGPVLEQVSNTLFVGQIGAAELIGQDLRKIAFLPWTIFCGDEQRQVGIEFGQGLTAHSTRAKCFRRAGDQCQTDEFLGSG